MIRVDVPASDARRERVERAVFDGLAAARTADRADAAAPRPRRWFAIAGGLVAVAAVIAIVLATRGSTPEPVAPAAPSLVVTPVGGASRFVVGDAVIDAGGDTSVQVATDAGGGITLALARGSVDCDVAPRAGRPPFRVRAGDVLVEVVGTRFTVARGASTRVDVARGRVHVTVGGGPVQTVVAGASWTDAPPPPPPAPIVEPLPVPAPPPPPAPAKPSAKALFEQGTRLEAKDADAAARTYRQAASTGGDRWAALALYSLAQLDATRSHLAPAIAEVDEYLRRFPHGANADDAAWLRVETLRAAGRTGDARAAAARYLHDFPDGTYAAAARGLAP